MNIILDFKFAMFDRGENREEVATKERKEHKDEDVRFCVLCVPLRQSVLGLDSSVFQTRNAVRPVWAEKRTCNPLMVNSVKPSQGKSNHSPILTKPVSRTQPPEIARARGISKLIWPDASKSRVNTLKYGYARLRTAAGEIIFPEIERPPAPKPYKLVMFRKGS